MRYFTKPNELGRWKIAETLTVAAAAEEITKVGCLKKIFASILREVSIMYKLGERQKILTDLETTRVAAVRSGSSSSVYGIMRLDIHGLTPVGLV